MKEKASHIIHLKIASFNLRIWQCRPAKPPVQLQTAPAALSRHFPLLVQFRLEQLWEESSRSLKRQLINSLQNLQARHKDFISVLLVY